VTNGGAGERRRWLYAWLAFFGIGLAFAIVNAASVIDERAALGRPVAAWQPWVWELTSLAAMLLFAPLVFAAAARFRPPRFGVPQALALHLGCSVIFSLAHVGLMLALRKLIYAAAGDTYDFAGPIGDVLVYEYRKDLITYAAAALTFLLIGRALGPTAPEAAQPFRIEVRDGSRTVWLAPEDVEWAQSAGNYVELHGPFGTLLHRETLASLEETLAPRGFRRIHRSRLVRAAAVRSVSTRPSGDFDVSLASGEQIAGSRRFRDRLAT
jgi:DNA-binding LytR/AlgR family response regulator